MRPPFALLFCLWAAAAPNGYHLIKSIPLPGNGSWDYLTVDAAARRLYVSHGTEVQVVDVDSDALVGTIPGTRGVHGIALAPEFGRGFTSNGASNTVTMFDLKTLKPLAEIAVEKKPDAIIYDPATRRVFANNGDSDSTTAIDAATGKVVRSVALGGAPEFAASDGAGHLFINLEDKSETVKLDARDLKVVARWPLAPCETPSSMAIDTRGGRLFIGCRNHKMAVLDTASGRVVATAPIGDHVDATVWDPRSRTVFFSNGDGTINAFRQYAPDRYAAAPTIGTLAGAKTMAFDPKTARLFLSTAETTRAGGKRTPTPGSFKVLVVGR